jgi:hypothetical protein
MMEMKILMRNVTTTDHKGTLGDTHITKGPEATPDLQMDSAISNFLNQQNLMAKPLESALGSEKWKDTQTSTTCLSDNISPFWSCF